MHKIMLRIILVVGTVILVSEHIQEFWGILRSADVLGGAVIGICCACLAMWLVPKLERKFPKLTETVYRV